MTDIVARLAVHAWRSDGWTRADCAEAAAEIERLRAEVASLRITLGGRTFGPSIPEPIGCPAPGACAQVAEIERLRKDNADILATVTEGWDQARKRQDQVRNLEAERDRLRSGWLVSIQTENSCVTTGQPCRVRCGCALEQEALANARAALKETGHE